MALFKFPSPVLPEGTTFVFGSWVCVANGAGGFRRHIVDDTIKLKTLASRLDDFVDNLDELPFFVSTRETEAESVTTVPFSALEKDLDSLLQARGSDATACRGAEDHLATCGLMITTTSEGRIVHWKGMDLSDLLGHEDRLVAHLEPLPFQEGRALATIIVGSTELVEAPSEELATRQVLMAEEGDNDALIPIGTLDGISEDEDTADAVDENDAERDMRRARNRARAVRRRRANERIRSAQRELDAEFAAADEQGFRTPVANIAWVTALLERSNDPNVRQALRYAQRAWVQLNQQAPASHVRDEHVGDSRSQAPSRTTGNRSRPQRSNNNDGAGGSQVTGGRWQPPPANNLRQPNPPHQQPNLRQKINEGRNVRLVLDSRRREREGAERDDADCSDRFPAFTARFNSYKYPEGFKPIGITRYDGKQAPQQWLRCYSTAIEVAGGSNTTKVVYFPMALEPALLTWLESLPNDSIDSWEGLKKVFIDNFQGAITRAGTRHDLAQCKQERNELLRSYTRRFFDVRATIANITEEDIIDCIYNSLTDPGIYRDFGRNRPKTVAGLRDMMHD
jgi:hypothetical protein